MRRTFLQRIGPSLAGPALHDASAINSQSLETHFGNHWAPWGRSQAPSDKRKIISRTFLLAATPSPVTSLPPRPTDDHIRRPPTAIAGQLQKKEAGLIRPPPRISADPWGCEVGRLQKSRGPGVMQIDAAPPFPFFTFFPGNPACGDPENVERTQTTNVD